MNKHLRLNILQNKLTQKKVETKIDKTKYSRIKKDMHIVKSTKI
jgi:hypothetical protein